MAASLQQPGTSQLDQDIWTLLQALPTRTDIKALIFRLEETHCCNKQEVRENVSNLTDRVTAGEASFSTLEHPVSALEQSRDAHRDTAIALQLHLEDIEDQSCRNNLRLRGLPEAMGAENLGETVTAIFHTIVETPSVTLEIDSVHRALGPILTDSSRSWDVVCRLHHYRQKDDILRRAWKHGDVELDEVQIRILPDLFRATLQRRALLRPILVLAKQRGCTYRWGYPLAVTFRRDMTSFTLHTPAELPALFNYLEADPIPDWLQILP